MATGGIFCLEGEWDRDMRKRRSVEPILELLDRLDQARFIHRDVATVEEMQYLIDTWQAARYNPYRLLYLAMHGDTGSVSLGRDDLSLEKLGEVLEDRCHSCIVYFGSCLTLSADEDEIKRFVKRTGAIAAVGYTTEIDWVISAAFEVLLLQQLVLHLSDWRRADYMFRRIAGQHGEFAESLGLTMVTKTKTYRASARPKTEVA